MHTKSLSRVQIKDAELGQVTAVFSTFDVVDLDGDVTRKGAFTDGAQVVISAYGHGSWDGVLPVGKGTIHEGDTEAVLEGQFFMDTAHGADTFRIVKALSESGLQEWSYSLQNVTSELGEFDGRDVRFIKSVKVKEVSPVLVGAGIGTRTLATKASKSFSEHASAVLADVGGLIERASDVVALRAEKGKPISPASLDLLKLVETELGRLKALIDPPAPTTPPDLRAEWLRSIAILQGVPTS